MITPSIIAINSVSTKVISSEFAEVAKCLIKIIGTAKYTLSTAISPTGDLVADGFYTNFTDDASFEINYAGKFVIDVTELGAGSEVKIEYFVIQ